MKFTINPTDGKTDFVRSDADILAIIPSMTHNLLGGKQGGTTNEYYHLTSAENSGDWGIKKLSNISSSGGYEYLNMAIAGNTYGVLSQLAPGGNNRIIISGAFYAYGTNATTGQGLTGIMGIAEPHSITDTSIGGYFCLGYGNTLNDPTVDEIGLYVVHSCAGTDANAKKWAFYNATNDNGAYVGGKVFLGGDNHKTYWGHDKDASIYYDGTDLNINPKEVGTGIVKISSGLIVTGTTTLAVALTGMTYLTAGVVSVTTDLPTATTIGGAYIYRVSGTDVAIADGGTGVSSWTQYGIVYASTTTALSQIGAGTIHQLLTSGGAGIPTWSTVTENAGALAAITTIGMSGALTNTLAIGNAPLVVTSTTVCTNLNADLWDGYQFSDYLNQAVKTTSSPQFANVKITNGGYIYPSANATTAINIAQLDGTCFCVWDTTNKRMGIGAATAPTSTLTVSGDTAVTGKIGIGTPASINRAITIKDAGKGTLGLETTATGGWLGMLSTNDVSKIGYFGLGSSLYSDYASAANNAMIVCSAGQQINMYVGSTLMTAIATTTAQFNRIVDIPIGTLRSGTDTTVTTSGVHVQYQKDETPCYLYNTQHMVVTTTVVNNGGASWQLFYRNAAGSPFVIGVAITVTKKQEITLPSDITSFGLLCQSAGGSNSSTNITTVVPTGGCYINGSGYIEGSLEVGETMTVGNFAVENSFVIPNNKYIKFLTALGADDGTGFKRTTSDGFFLAYNANSMVFQAIGDNDFRIWNSAGVAQYVFKLAVGETTFNDAGANIDFRFESDANNSMFFIDGGASRVGIGTAVPDVVLDVRGATNIVVDLMNILKLKRPLATATALAGIESQLYNASSAYVAYGNFGVQIETNTAGAERGNFAVWLRNTDAAEPTANAARFTISSLGNTSILGNLDFKGIDLSKMCYCDEDFRGPVAPIGKWGWGSVAYGSATVSTDITLADGNHAGIIALSTGTDVDAQIVVYLDILSGYLLSNGVCFFETLIYLPILSTAIQEYEILVGLGNSLPLLGSFADHTNGVYFKYRRATSVNWICVTADNGSLTSTTTATAVGATAWIKLAAIINAAGTSVGFYINGTLVATHTTNIPIAAGRLITPSLSIRKTVGTTARVMDVDYHTSGIRYTTPR
jgi:hypothetical protein